MLYFVLPNDPCGESTLLLGSERWNTFSRSILATRIEILFTLSKCCNKSMAGYYYLDDPKSELEYTPVSEDKMVSAILSIAKSHGLNITDEMILDQIQKKESKSKNTKKKSQKTPSKELKIALDRISELV